MSMTAAELRQIWTRFFTERQHTPVPSAGLIPHHPTAPIFTNSGMMQFVPYFLGEEPVPYSPRRASSIQKCVRAGGKHNDLDAIGRSLRHLSFFEMLGNFSFGDYFKAEAIPWAWEFVTETLGIDGDRIWVTVHVSDDDAEEIWADAVGFPRDRIQRLDKDNFWEMGDVGPCGPSSELFFDFGPEQGPEGGPENPAAEERYVEFWNLVFMQYFRDASGELTDLPQTNVDTGAGLERILGVLVDSASLYACDTLTVLLDEAQSVTGRRLGDSPQGDVALHLLADHTRTMSFLVADGVIPSNEDRGYVLRRIIRRAVRFAYLLGVDRPVTSPMIERCIAVMGDAYPELVANSDLVLGICSREEAKFRQTLKTGVTILDQKLDEIDDAGLLPGETAFLLHDTYGFPLEVTQEIVADRGIEVDVDGFEREMTAQRDRARAAGKGSAAATGDDAGRLQQVVADHGPTDFVGRELNESDANILAIVGDVVVLDRTPFYAEAGGQIGDTGTIVSATGRAKVLDTTVVAPGLTGHHVELIDGELQEGQDAHAAIDVERRDAIKRNHTGTHILHWALREVLGDHVKQQGSLVAPDRLRFDFSHFDAVTDEQITAIEDLANREILTNAPVNHFETTKAEALARGAIAFFGEKYGDQVRVLEAGEHSVELCGGTHVHALGDIGPVKVVSEGSIGANMRRIFAVTGTGPIELLREDERVLGQVAELVGVPVGEVVDGVTKRLEEIKSLRDELKVLRRHAAAGQAEALAGSAVGGVVLDRVDGISRNDLRDLAVALRDRPGIEVVVLAGAPDEGGAALVAAVTKDSGHNAGELLKDAAGAIKGGGGRDPELAVAGGKDPGGLDEALALIRAALES